LTGRVLLGAAAAAVGIVLAVVLWGRGGESPAAGRAVLVNTALSPELPGFADRLSAELRVLVDDSRVDPGSVRIQARFAPYRSLGPPTRSESTRGETTLLRYRFELECLTRACLPRPEPFVLPPAQIRYRGKGAGLVTASWPAFLVAPRIKASDLARPRMRDGLRPLPEVSYRAGPDALAYGLGGAGALLVLGAAGLLVGARQRPASASQHAAESNGALSPLEAALALVWQAAASGDAHMQRKALERLGTELRRSRMPRLAHTARRLAWSEPEPRAERTEALAHEVALAVEERR
jgi:hypothetical protein